MITTLRVENLPPPNNQFWRAMVRHNGYFFNAYNRDRLTAVGKLVEYLLYENAPLAPSVTIQTEIPDDHRVA